MIPAPYDNELYSPWAIFRGNDIFWLGMARGEEAAWIIGLSWPSDEEVKAARAIGLCAAPVGLVSRHAASNNLHLTQDDLDIVDFILGNHDNLNDLSREDVLELVRVYRAVLGSVGPQEPGR